MKALQLTQVILCIIIPGLRIWGQGEIEISRPDLSMSGRDLLVGYHIARSTLSDTFDVRILITDSDGDPIEATSLRGDIGGNVPGGGRKMILWDLEKDSIYLDEQVFVEVIARKINQPPEPGISPEPVSGGRDTSSMVAGVSPDHVDKRSDSSGNEDSFNRASLVWQSLALPGLGLSRANPGKPHWIRGVAGYGCIAGALYFNRRAVDAYNAYKNPESLGEVDELFTRSRNQDLLSEVLAYTAAGIWVTDFIWTMVGTARDSRRISLAPSVFPFYGYPMVALKYRF